MIDRDAFEVRAERGTPRGATWVLAAARTAPRWYVEIDEPPRRHLALALATAAAALLLVLGIAAAHPWTTEVPPARSGFPSVASTVADTVSPAPTATPTTSPPTTRRTYLPTDVVDPTTGQVVATLPPDSPMLGVNAPGNGSFVAYDRPDGTHLWVPITCPLVAGVNQGSLCVPSGADPTLIERAARAAPLDRAGQQSMVDEVQGYWRDRVFPVVRDGVPATATLDELGTVGP